MADAVTAVGVDSFAEARAGDRRAGDRRRCCAFCRCIEWAVRGAECCVLVARSAAVIVAATSTGIWVARSALVLPLQNGTKAVLQGGDGAGAIGGTAGSATTCTGTGHISKCPGFWKRETGHWAIAGIGFVAKRSEVRLPAYWP